MSSSANKSTEIHSPNISAEVLLSVATVPVLLVLVGGKALAGLAQEIGQMSEEVFRGDRLPILNWMNSKPEQSDNPDSI